MIGLTFFFFFQAEDGIRDPLVTGVQTCALPIYALVAEAVGHASGRVLTAITPSDLEVPMTGARYQRFNEFVQRSIVSERTARVKLWATDGTVIYSDDPAGVGLKFPDNEGLLKALS